MCFSLVEKAGQLILTPNDEETYKILNKYKKLKIKYIYLKEIKGRNIKLHRKLFAIIKKVINNLNDWYTPEEFLIILKIKMGYYKTVNLNNKKYIIPKSISFSEMDNEEFSIFYKTAVSIMAKILGVSVEQLEEEALNEINY